MSITNSTLERRTPLKRARSKRPRDPGFYRKAKPDFKPKFERKTELKPRSKKQDARLREYHQVQREFLARVDRRYCEICLCRSLNLHLSDVRVIMAMSIEQSERALTSMGALTRLSTENHHTHGRVGSLLCDERGFVASCYPCRDFPHTNGKWARAHGLLAQPADWNNPRALDKPSA